MPIAYEHHLIVLYLANAAGRLRHRDREASKLATWLADHCHHEAFDGRNHLRSLMADRNTA